MKSRFKRKLFGWAALVLLGSTASLPAQLARKMPAKVAAAQAKKEPLRKEMHASWIGMKEAENPLRRPLAKKPAFPGSSLRSSAKALDTASEGAVLGTLDGPPYVDIDPGKETPDVYTSVVGDFDHKNGVDFADITMSGILNVYWNDGKGGFGQTYTNSEMMDANSGVAYSQAVDVNGDGYLDIVASDAYGNRLLIFLNDGGTKFNAAAPIPNQNALGGQLVNGGGFAAADINHDGMMDLVLVSIYVNEDTFVTSAVTQTLLGHGDGTFTVANETDSPFDAYFYVEFGSGVALKDLNGDGELDLVVELAQGFFGETVTMAPALGHNGHFATLAEYGSTIGSGESNEANLEMADVNGDGNMDALFLPGDGNLYVAQGVGDGSFQTPVPLILGRYRALTFHFADLNGDGISDLLLYMVGGAQVYPGIAGGAFGPVAAASYTGPASIGDHQSAPVDLNGDGVPDFVWADPAYGHVFLYESKADGSYGASRLLVAANTDASGPNIQEFPENLRVISTGDFNGDGKSDLLAWDLTSAPTDELADAHFALSDGKGNFTFTAGLSSKQQAEANVQRMLMHTADFNNDGLSDVTMQANDGGVSIGFANKDGGISKVTSVFKGADFSFDCLQIEDLALGDVNHDGVMDIVSFYEGYAGCYNDSGTPAGYVVSLSDGKGGFSSTFTPYGREVHSGSLVDLNGDGVLDLVINESRRSSRFYQLSALPGKGDGTFDAANPRILVSNSVVVDVLSGDFNHDGIQDLALPTQGALDEDGKVITGSGGVLYLAGKNDFTFADPLLLDAGAIPEFGLTADVNGDGIPDILFGQYGSDLDYPASFGLVTLLSKGDGTFQEPTSVATPAARLFAADFNGDGAVDLGVQSLGLYVPAAVVMNTRGTSLTLSASPLNGTVGDTVVLTALLESTTGAAAPSGTVSFYANGELVDAVPIASGSAQLSVTTLSAGDNVITASYSGDGAHNVASSKSITVTMITPVLAPTIKLSSSSTQLSMQTGKSSSMTLSVAANEAFNGSVNFACSGLPAGSTCSFSPASVTLKASGTESVQLQIQAGPLATARADTRSVGPGTGLGAIFAALLLGVGLRGGRMRRIFLAMMVLAALGMTGMLSGCGDDGYSKPTSSTTVITVTASGTMQGQTVTQSIPVALTITK